MHKTPKVLFVGVFDNAGRSTNNSQIVALRENDCRVFGYNYRDKAVSLGALGRDKDLVDIVKKHKFDLVIYSKCNMISLKTFEQINELATTCLWFMDPIVSYNDEMRAKTSLVDYFCCDKKNVLDEAKKVNNASYHVCEGYDERVDKIVSSSTQTNDVSFIGNLYGHREKVIEAAGYPVKNYTNVYGIEHSIAVADTKINLNICTGDGASDRVYKVLAAGGFLLTDDWAGRGEQFVDGKDLVIFTDTRDLRDKIGYYLNNSEERQQIASEGSKTVRQYTRHKWASRLLEIYEQTK